MDSIPSLHSNARSWLRATSRPVLRDESAATGNMYIEANLAMKERALAKLQG